MSKVIHISSSSEFNKILASSNKLVVVDVYAQWCGPCKVIAPTYEKLSEEYSKKAVFLKVDVDAVSDLTSALGISAMPTFQFYKNGKILVQFQGANISMLKNNLKALTN